MEINTSPVNLIIGLYELWMNDFLAPAAEKRISIRADYLE
jgi:hypothetical protein